MSETRGHSFKVRGEKFKKRCVRHVFYMESRGFLEGTVRAGGGGK